jgi:hypothetical protein
MEETCKWDGVTVIGREVNEAEHAGLPCCSKAHL